jgi:hypothetical protein
MRRRVREAPIDDKSRAAQCAAGCAKHRLSSASEQEPAEAKRTTAT